MVAPLVAVIVTVSPVEPPEADIVGVVSVVLLSVFEEPVSDPLARSGVEGAEGAVVSIEIDNSPEAVDAPAVG